MSETIEVRVPDIGDFSSVEVIEVLVAPGDRINPEDSLITLESDKASMEIPSPQGGVVKDLRVKVGDAISEGDVILTLEAESADEDATAAEPAAPQAETPPPAPASAPTGEADIQAEVVVLGSGPGGYTAAFRAADLGKRVVLIERYPVIGGVCLNVGCIPSKALLHVAEVITEAREFSKVGVDFGEPKIDIDKLRGHKEKVVGQLTGGLKQLAKQRKVEIVQGYGRFTSPNTIAVESESGQQVIAFEHCIIAAGSSVARPGFIPWDDPRVIDSTGALALEDVPKNLLIVGGGIIGMEMAAVYHALGAEITVVELADGLMPGADRDLVRLFEKNIKRRYKAIHTRTRVTAITPDETGLICEFEGEKAPEKAIFDKVLVAIGRSPNGALIDADKAGVAVDERGFIAVDKQQRTNVDHIFAIGDIVGQPMLAHKATHEGKVAAEVIAGKKSYFDARTIPSVAYTDPEIAWCGLTETEAKETGVEYEKGVFPWAASGRALSMDAANGMTKILFDKNTHRVIGAGIVGRNAGELIAEAVLALEMGADMADLALTIHPHPTLSETLNFAAEVAEGTVTDLYAPKKRG
ncbi:MAG TPA: dihydrolipoyl dehydrogenase [Gammaproteobacteria bacterium]|nr:dihydrolipoyl dehydrogenase [Gammaproteobacteria bacterium]